MEKVEKAKSFGLILVVAACLLAGCTRDPQVLKKKYLNKGNTYLAQGKYPEAAIEYANAIKLDPRYAEAHYQLAQCFLKQTDWPHGYQELMRAVDLDPTNWN